MLLPMLRAAAGCALSVSIILFLGVGAGAGCAGPTRAPRSLLRQYADAVERNDADAAYRLLSEGVKKGVSRDDFKRRWREYRGEALVQAQDLRKSIPRAPKPST